jgi:sugar phosphate isomerase/epimerase
MVWTLTGLGDEIDPAIEVQLATLADLGIAHLELRGAWGKNVAALSDEEVDRIGAALADRRMKLSAIASPIGKIGVLADFAPHLATFHRVVEIAERLEAPYVRIFSFYIPAGDDPARHREAVLDRLRRIVDAAAGSPVELLHENEKGIYGDTPARCHDLLTALDSPRLQAVWDPANFVQVGVRPFTDGYDLLRPHVAYVHVKDARLATDEVVPAGEGDGEWRETIAALRDDDFDGFFSLEPHLQAAGPFGGFSGPELFGVAVRALTGLLEERGIAWG